MNSWKISTLFLSLLTIMMSFSGFSQKPNPEKLQEMVQSCISKAYAASVFIVTYDTVAKHRTGTRFSGVVVSKDGIILTAAHVGRPGGTYLVIFPDGKEHVAVGMGRIQQFDAAMLKITKQAEWPYADLGWSSSLKVNEPCVSIAYPGSFNPFRSVIRFGYIADKQGNSRRQMLRTTCLMEPGDSGGPVFDLYGRVIGLHSNITMELENNFEVPIDNFRKYWSAFQKAEDYRTLPPEEVVPADPLVNERISFDQINSLELSLAGLEEKMDDYTASVISQDTLKAVAFSIKATGFLPRNVKGKSFLISKNSLIKEGVQVKMPDGKLEKATVLYRDEQKDLVLLSVNKKLKAAFDLSKAKKDSVSKSLLGQFLISPHPENEGEISVIGTTTFTFPDFSRRGYFGSALETKEGRNLISSVMEKSPASTAGLAVGDEVFSINGSPISSPEVFVQLVQKRRPEDVIQLVFARNGTQKAIDVKLGKRPVASSNHIAERFKDGKSERLDGFNYAFVHDSKLKPAECGGPIFDLKGNLMGLNMARLSRTSSIAVSNIELLGFLEAARSNLSK